MKRPSWLRWPCVSAEWADTLQARVERRETERDEALDAKKAAQFAARTAAEKFVDADLELLRCKDVIAMHIVAAGHPSTVLHSPQEFATALQQALADAGVDLTAELARLEGADL
ncbi:hypothetical protein [Streptomyces sp. ME18-1-4]|uniref:hypothetical protein n=1 Tax=Streptomyces sp. ME18-1-4 TaxID=3028685 RepID=UPI0029A9B456|nr:hypothetical protein [Streptomyces sp. ME18-1-4]MDX3243497.1 hypothetical protein [Streptomyces sp. ME18-1-4]